MSGYPESKVNTPKGRSSTPAGSTSGTENSEAGPDVTGRQKDERAAHYRTGAAFLVRDDFLGRSTKGASLSLAGATLVGHSEVMSFRKDLTDIGLTWAPYSL